MNKEAVSCEHCGWINWFEEEKFKQIIKDGVTICTKCSKTIDVNMHDTILQLGKGRSLDIENRKTSTSFDLRCQAPLLSQQCQQHKLQPMCTLMLVLQSKAVPGSKYM